jgi:metal-responsive CopG/Arc/MetJ family transcriptional regulator
MRVSISVPAKVFRAGERVARQQGITRSELYTKALTAYLEGHYAAVTTAQFDVLFGKTDSSLNPALASAQLRLLTDESW